MHRRTLLSALAAGGTAALAGCNAFAHADDDPPATPTPPVYDALRGETVYVAPDVSLSLPEGVATTAVPAEATLVILSDDPDVGPERGIEWLAAGTGVAFVGPDSQDALLAWLQSAAYTDHFESNGLAEGSPPPDFVVAFGVDGQYVSTHNYTWAGTDDPSDQRYLTAIEEALRDAREGFETDENET